MATKGTKRVDAVDSRSASVLVRAKDGSAFAKWFVILIHTLFLRFFSSLSFIHYFFFLLKFSVMSVRKMFLLHSLTCTIVALKPKSKWISVIIIITH